MIFEWVLKGGWVMLPLILFSIVSLAVIFEKAFQLLSSRVLSKPLIQALEEGRPFQEVNLTIEKDSTVLGEFLRRIRNKGHESKEILEELAQSYFKKTWNRLEKRLEILNIVATTSPLLGLLGTVIGMVSIFQGLAHSGAGDSLVLSKGISEALITTITGLTIAVPALIGYTYFTKKIENFLIIFEECAKLYIAQMKGLVKIEEPRATEHYVG